MAPNAVGAGTLKRLALIQTGGHPVLSVNPDLDSASLSPRAAAHAHLDLLYDAPELGSTSADLDQVQALPRA